MFFDLLILNGLIVDGTGKAGYRADLAVSGGKIAAIGDLVKARARVVIPAEGLVVAPGFIDTAMTRALNDSQQEAILQQIPLNRMGNPEDIAHAVEFLASENAAYITGTILHVNGGMY